MGGGWCVVGWLVVFLVITVSHPTFLLCCVVVAVVVGVGL